MGNHPPQRLVRNPYAPRSAGRVDAPVYAHAHPHISVATPAPTSVSELDFESLARQLKVDGYIRIPNVVPQQLLLPAIRVINRSLGTHMPIREKQCPDCTNAPEIVALFNASPANEILRRLLGDYYPAGGAQIALRFPGDACDETFRPHPNVHKGWHIDGLPSGGINGPPLGEIHNFSALVGIMLQDVPAGDMGNLIVHPGSHTELSNYFNAVGFRDVLSMGGQGLPHNLPFSREHVQVCGNAGDLIIVNYMMAHAVAPNTSPYIRYVTYFRLTSKHNTKPGKHRAESMLNPWIDWDGVSDVETDFNISATAPKQAHMHATYGPATDSYENDLKLALQISARST